MSSSVGRFNLRTRKSMKLFGQIECTSCHRFYFPPENADDEIDDDGNQTSEKLCCDCEEKKQYELPPKRRRQNGVPSSPIITKIKQEKIDSDDMQPRISDRISPITNFDSDRMVQIHSSELLTQPMVPLNINISAHLEIKKENISTGSDVIIGSSKPTRAHRKKANPVNCDDTQNQTTPNQTCIDVKSDAVITKMDTVNSLREKFPKATPYEFEFLMFLKECQQ